MNARRLIRQTELSNILDFYRQAWLQNSGKEPIVYVGTAAEPVIPAADNAGVYFASPDAVLAGDLSDAPLRTSLGDRVMDCAASLIASGIPLENIPDELRICMPVNHLQVHWTGCVVSIPHFRKWMASLYPKCGTAFGNDHFLQARNAIGETFGCKYGYTDAEKKTIKETLGLTGEKIVRGNRYSDNWSQEERELIFAQLGFVEYDLPSERIDKLFSVLPDVRIVHYDSVNSQFYNNRVVKGFGESTLGRNVHFEPVSRQTETSNGCGDHTAANLFSGAIFGCTPLINKGRRGASTLTLRELTNSLPVTEADRLAGGREAEEATYVRKTFPEAVQAAWHLLESMVPSFGLIPANSPSEEKIDNSAELDRQINHFVEEITQTVSALETIAGPDTVALIQNVLETGKSEKGLDISLERVQAFVAAHNAQYPERPVTEAQILQHFKRLVCACAGEQGEATTNDRDQVVYSAVAQILLSDTCVELQRRGAFSRPPAVNPPIQPVAPASLIQRTAPIRPAGDVLRTQERVPVLSRGSGVAGIIGGGLILAAVITGLFAVPVVPILAGVLGALSVVAAAVMAVFPKWRQWMRGGRPTEGGESPGTGPEDRPSGTHAGLHKIMGSLPALNHLMNRHEPPAPPASVAEQDQRADLDIPPRHEVEPETGPRSFSP